MRKDLATMAVNMEDYERIPPMRRVRDACVLRVYPDGRVALNGKLLEEVKRKNGSLELGFAWHKTDKRFVLLFPTENPTINFLPKGCAGTWNWPGLWWRTASCSPPIT